MPAFIIITGQIKQQYWENNLIANEDETLSCKDKIQKKYHVKYSQLGVKKNDLQKLK